MMMGPLPPRRRLSDLRPLAAALCLALAVVFLPGTAVAAGPAQDGPGDNPAWTVGNKMAIGTSATTASRVWFTVAQGVTTEVFYPRADVPNVQDLQYVVSDGSTFTDLERDATNHVVTLEDERALEYTITNTAKSGKYRLTNAYVTDPKRNSLLIRTRFQSLDGGTYEVFALYNPSLAGDGASDTVAWDGPHDALTASDDHQPFPGTEQVATALKVSTGWAAHDNGYANRPSDGYVDLRADNTLNNQFDSVQGPGNTVQLGRVAGVGADTTFTLALGFGPDRTTALAAADGSLNAGFAAASTDYRNGWNAYVQGLAQPIPASVSGDALRRRTYLVGVMSLHAMEDKTYPGASVAGLATPWGNLKGDSTSDGYHRVWGRDLYQQATALLAAGDRAQATRMATWIWTHQYIGSWTEGAGRWYGPGSFPRYSPVSGINGATPQELGCCEQLDQDSFAILLAWMTGLTDAATYAKIKVTAGHIQTDGPDTLAERWEEQAGKSPSTIAAEIAGLVAAADIARSNHDTASAASWEHTADTWRTDLPGWTITHVGFWDGHQYYDRIEDASGNPNDNDTRHFKEGDFAEHDIVDAGFLELVRLGIKPPADPLIAQSLQATDVAYDDHAPMKVTLPNGDQYWHRYVHDSYGESTVDGSGWTDSQNDRGRLWPLLSGERGEYELANHRSATIFLTSMADAGNPGYLLPEQVWDEPDAFGFTLGEATNSATPLAWSEAQYVRLAQSIDAGHPTDTPTVVQNRYASKP